MPYDIYVRRDRSALSFRGRRRRHSPWLFGVVLIALAGAALILSQRDTIQPAALALVGIHNTPTPTILESAQQGDRAYWRGNLNDAITHYRMAATIAPENVDVVYELVRMLIYRSYADERNRPDIDEAVTWSEKAVDANPRSSRAFAIYCFALVRAARPEEAVQACNRAINANPNDADAHAYLALAYYDLDRLEDASIAGRKALELNPNSIEGNTAFGFILTALRRADAAITYLEKAAATNKRLEYPYFNLAGTALSIALQRNDEAMYVLAVKAYDTILSMNKRSVKAYTSLCRAYFARGERNLARDNCRTAVDLDATYTPAWRTLGEVNYMTLEYDQAVEAFSQCRDREKDLPATARQSECWAFLGLSYVQSGDCASARPVFDDVLGWTRSTRAIDLTNKGIAACQARGE